MSADTIIVSGDLMDRSKLNAAVPGAITVRTVDEALDAVAGSDVELTLVDLRHTPVDGLATLVAQGVRVVAFGSHVDDETLAAAAETGAEALPRSVFFRRLADGSI